MSTVSASSNSASVVQTAGTVPERQAAPVPTSTPSEQLTSVQKDSKRRDKLEENAAPAKEAVAHAAKRIEAFVKSMDRNLSFDYDTTSGHRVVRVTDATTGELIRQMPSDETLRIAKTIDYLSHALVSQKA